MLTDFDRQSLIDATTAARARMRDEHDSWPSVERNDEAEHVAPILDRLLDLYATRSLDVRRAVA